MNNIISRNSYKNSFENNNILLLDHVSRSYINGNGNSKIIKTVLHDINLHIDRGEILCLVGPNGAGKTTTVKIAGTLLTPDKGTVHINGIDAVKNPYNARKHMSLLLGGESGFYRRVSAIDNLRYFADLAGVAYKNRDQQVKEALERVGLLDHAHDRVQTFSRGMWQRLHIARAIVNDAELLLLDEPTTGLDPENARSVRALIQKLRVDGMAILLTTHEMSEAEKLADSVAVINRGTIIARGSVQQLAEREHIDHVSSYAYERETLPENLIKQLWDIPGVRWLEASQNHGIWNINIAWSLKDSRSAMSVQDAELRLMGERPASLEETYLAILHNVKEEQ